MEEHFTLKNSIYLIAGGEELDLHNNYDFVGLDYSIADRVLILRWLLSPGDWVTLNSPSEVELEYRDVARFEFRPRDPEMPFTEDDCLWDAGYWREAGWPDGVCSAAWRVVCFPQMPFQKKTGSVRFSFILGQF